MAITYVESQSVSNDNAGTSIVVPALTADANGDVLVGLIAIIGQVAITGVPSGWTALGTQDDSTNMRSVAYDKVAASESGTYTWTLASAFKNVGWIGCFRGAVAAPPVAAFTSAAGNAGTSHTCPTVAVPAGGWLISAAACRFANTGLATTWTNASGDTERFEYSSTNGANQDITAAVYTAGPLSAGNYGRTLTASQSVSQVTLWSIALAPVSAPSSGGGWSVGVPIF